MANDRTSSWDMLALLLWAVVFAAGLVPDLAFNLLRVFANVSPHKALVNSSYALTLAFSGYFAVFVLQRCREAGASEAEARAKSVLAGLLGLAAFLELPTSGVSPFEPTTFLEVLINVRTVPDAYVRSVVLAVGISKLCCWWYLFHLLLRYYAFGNRAVFRTVPPVFPSVAPKNQPASLKTETSPVPDSQQAK